ncbi:RNA polymerase-binding protein DksA [Rhodanobacter sp. 115]|uniref:RNA polymerase-binding protein DksA n=1 Tax=Rhodanobacter sp. FW021-MT20 TaxID=1162282 RepID=UPI001ED8EF7E|nr:RNA polymerase-binding protein DksA [Rhodanobacter sp. 115]
MKKPVAKKAAPKKVAPKKAPVSKTSATKVAKKATAAAHKPAAKPAKSAVKASRPTKPVAKAAPVHKAAHPAAAKPAPSKPAAAPAKGHATGHAVASPRVASATARYDTSTTKKPTQSSMNKSATVLDNGVTKEDGRYALPSTITIDLPKGYRPTPDEEYMGPRQLAYFRNKLRDWRDQLVEESRQTMENLRDEVRDVGDEAERATRETENSLELRTRDRYRKLISKIDKALRRIEEGRYGYCEETDEEIGVDRLDARPIATLSLDAQERREHLQKQMGD